MDQHWDDLIKHFCSVSDGLGMPIDDEIFETVVALNALGITTTMSCAGHITRDDGDVRYPWINFSASDDIIQKLKTEQIKLHKKAEKRQKKLMKLRKKLTSNAKLLAAQKKSHKAWHAYHAIGHQLRKLQVPMRQRVIDYLTQFYENRPVLFDRRLILDLISTTTRLESQGAADFHLCEPREVQIQKLAEYREEMRAFTEFLKTIYLSQQTEKVAV
ncbi:hypothetical protein EPA93_13240 [Ktedonosporobacter rubrisoli]|uniref:Uncharacterized protein n=1 Tax=Ktedonosporobacter rubrisoli TaxID=2509675 RepID=A0A4P6JQ74_KTERU|nr:hypothetical protein [Ktedonosporobacter rubrisoli]QBD76916.1 hypothetical protein EPA93_13240 [Ktedonosporobacter rubrisoli]